MKLLKLPLIFLILFLSVSCEKKEIEESYYSRTIFVYLVANNNISSSLANNIPDMLTGIKSYGKGCKLVIYWDGPSGVPTLSEYQLDKEGTLSDEIILTTYGEQDSTSPEITSMIFEDFFNLCPSDSYGLIMGSHGNSWLPEKEPKTSRGFGDDGGNEITIPDLAGALGSVISKPFDFILFDACLMSSIEVVYELRKVTEYIIASPAEILAYGFPYADLMAFLFSDTTEDYTVKTAEEFISYYSSRFATIAVTKCSELDYLATVTRNILSAHTDELENFDVSSLQRYDRSALRYTYFAFDFEQFMRELATEEEYLIFKEQLDKVIIYKDFVNGYSPIVYINEDNYSGMAAYVMQSRHEYLNSYYKTLSWYYASGWDQTSW